MYPRTIIIAATAITISAGTARPQDAQKGQMVFNTQGGRFGGYGFYVLKGKPVFLYNYHDLQRTRWEAPDVLTPGKHTLEFDFSYDGLGFGTLAFNSVSGIGRGGTGVLDTPPFTRSSAKSLTKCGLKSLRVTYRISVTGPMKIQDSGVTSGTLTARDPTIPVATPS